MKALALLLFSAVVAFGGDKPKVDRAAIVIVEKRIDQGFEKLFPDNPYLLLGMTRGVYLDGYGAVFSAEVNLVLTAGLSPFRPRVTKEEVAQVKQQKLQRLPELRACMKDALISAALSMDMVPPEEQIVLAVSLFRHSWEDVNGVPQQILMQVARKTIVELKTAGADRKMIEESIQVREY